jgi:hypothetical protein
MRRPTERRVSLAAKQLAHHRARLPWMREQMEENEKLLRERLEASGERRLVLSGGFAVARAVDGGVIVGRLPIAENRFEQLELDAIRTTEDTPKEGDPDERRT